MFIRSGHRLTTSKSPGSNLLTARPAGQSGFSLVELLVVMATLLVVMGAVYAVWMGLSRTYAFTDEDISAQTQSRAAMAEMVEYIRTARLPLSVPVVSYDTVIPEAGPFSLTLWTDTKRDGSHNLQLIRFSVSPNPLTSPVGTRFELWREEGNASTCSFAEATPVRVVTFNVANDSANPLFRYYDTLGHELLGPITDPLGPITDPTQIRLVEINLRIDVNPGRSPVVNVLTSVVQPRNLRQ